MISLPGDLEPAVGWRSIPFSGQPSSKNILIPSFEKILQSSFFSKTHCQQPRPRTKAGAAGIYTARFSKGQRHPHILGLYKSPLIVLKLTQEIPRYTRPHRSAQSIEFEGDIMAEKKLYSIGEISEITDTSGKTLRYYDQIGLLKPGYKNPDTLYRYYTKDQVFSVFLIKKLQTLGFSLKEIQALMSEDTPDIYAREVSRKMKHLRKKIDEMERIYTEGILFIDKLEMKQERLEYFSIKDKEESVPSLDDQVRNREIRVETIPEMEVLYTRKRMTDYNNLEISINRWFELFKVAEKRGLPVAGSMILAYHTENPMEQFFKSTCELECMLPVKKGEQEFSDIKSFGGFNAATALHVGAYDTISATHLKLLKWIESQGLKLGGKICEEYMISPVDLNTSSGYVTKVIAPLAP